MKTRGRMVAAVVLALFFAGAVLLRIRWNSKMAECCTAATWAARKPCFVLG